MELPDAEHLVRELVRQLRAHLGAQSNACKNTALVGVHTGGVWLAERLHRELAIELPLGVLDISFYRDDFQRIGLHPQVKPSAIPFGVEDRDIILIDDVLYTGRTVRAAMNTLFDYGRPATIRLAALIDRGGRELPIAAQFVGARLPLDEAQQIELRRDSDGILSLHLDEAAA
ncbi:MAG: bifunctional pyr operon transcriptional regulator/uracil phosphoribosyltransferase PyrR [Burkholderiales bacterium]|nr:bifunctional pyr operon transcriptional regulator/uracil phosphoribosyltransferase PyrR [Burkholderiales bacterium]MDQ3196540.1 bifunctional pyr operon transcriptional regulator/uracil phosphoribosyltransferase PyrR [Pseudomonadota bacterium]